MYPMTQASYPFTASISLDGWQAIYRTLRISLRLAQDIVEVRSRNLYATPGTPDGRFQDVDDLHARMTMFYGAKGSTDFATRADLWPALETALATDRATV